MSKWITLVVLIGSSTVVVGQPSSAEYQPGTIMGVERHSTSKSDDTLQYEVAVKVENTTYTVLYTPPPGVNSVEYYKGLQLLVRVEDGKLIFNSRLTGSTEVPILRQTSVAASTSPDWSKASSQYFVMKSRNLSEALNLTEEQQARIKPTLEQEAGELSYLWGNPAMSTKDKLKELQRVVGNSDQKIKPLLSQEQRNKLEELRRQQKQELKKRLEKSKGS